MRKIEKQMLQAVMSKDNLNINNTRVTYLASSDKSEVYLHGNHIADYLHPYGELYVNTRTLKLWSSNTTKSRLRALGANVTTKKGITYYNGESI